MSEVSTITPSSVRIGKWRLNNLTVALISAIAIAILLAIVSVIIYTASGTSQLDLSRPGFEREREEVRPAVDSGSVFDSTSPVTREALDSFLKDFDRSKAETDKYGTFDPSPLEDAQLQLVPAPEPTNE